ncbi:MAG: hypothetical protein COA97_01005 [Flavobacteriales bacterium]|nr:MAG: hypothetical protein COA97_01005 [Flavobacteriales bacterium]
MNFKQLIIFFLTALILFSCAQIVPITGGERDVEAPIEVKSTPKNGSTLFTEKTITIEFDEFINLTNVSNQLIVSPLMETPPEILVRGKKLVIKLGGNLVENTTYSLNFGNSITDITENNVFPNYKYVFSTGTFIDSLSYSGTVVSSFNLSQKENIYVLLYDQFEDSIPYKELPRYVALTDKEGNFSITNIAHGDYKFFAINDINGNYLFDLPNEEIAFKNEVVQLDSSSSDNMVYLFEEESGLQYVIKAEYKQFGKIDVILNLPTENFSYTPPNFILKEPWYLVEKNETGDSISLWLNTFGSNETINLIIADAEEIIDTIEIDLMHSNKDSSLPIYSNITSQFNLNQPVFITTKRPISNFDFSKMELLEDSNSVDYKPSKIDSVGRKFKLDYSFKENTNYQLFIPPGTFEDIYGLKNDTVKIDFKTKSESDYGIINLSINTNFSKNYIVQLFKNDKLIRESHLKEAVKTQYKYLLPGNYELKLIIDSNNDKKWNTGNYLENLQPEKVIYYEKEIKIRANWDNDISWTVNE